ncbi:MAG: (d)CMP kinase [Bacteroidales bacterium]|nr:(d)CMP kinase [Bacteroidales bacterium]
MKLLHDIIIAIDGYSSCGKSTLAKNLARILLYRHIDTGAMYRAITYWALKNNFIDIKTSSINTKTIIDSLSQVMIEFRYNNKTLSNELWLNETFIEEEIRTPIVSEYTSQISQIPEVRQKMVQLQQQMGQNKRIVMDGRDIGTVVFPNAELKIFMTADPYIRAQRRYDELITKGIRISLEEVLNNIKERDYLDTHRNISPLRKASDAIVLDNSHLTKEEQLEWVIERIKERFPYEH